MTYLRSYQLRTSRRTDADNLAKQMVALAQRKAETKYQCTGAEVNAFTVGYLSSLLAQVASTSPAAMKELAAALNYAKENQ